MSQQDWGPPLSACSGSETVQEHIGIDSEPYCRCQETLACSDASVSEKNLGECPVLPGDLVGLKVLILGVHSLVGFYACAMLLWMFWGKSEKL